MRQKKKLTTEEAKTKKEYLKKWYENMKKNQTEEEAAKRRAKHNEAQKRYINKLRNNVKPRKTSLQDQLLRDTRKLEDKLMRLENILMYTMQLDAEKQLDELIHTLSQSNKRLRSFINKINK